MALVVFLGVFLQINSMQYKVKMARTVTNAIFTDLKVTFLMSNEVYDTLKWITTILLPSLSTLYVALSGIWNLPYTGEVSSTIAAIVLFLGALLQVSSLQYRASMRLVTGHSIYEPNPMPKASIFSLTNETYDFLKFIAQGVLPGIATLYVALAAIWDLPYSAQVSATTMALVLFMNALLQVSTAKYNAAVRLVYSSSKVKAVNPDKPKE